MVSLLDKAGLVHWWPGERNSLISNVSRGRPFQRFAQFCALLLCSIPIFSPMPRHDSFRYRVFQLPETPPRGHPPLFNLVPSAHPLHLDLDKGRA